MGYVSVLKGVWGRTFINSACRQGLVLYIGQEISVKFFIGVIDSVHRAGMFCHQVLVGLDFFQNKAIR